MPIRRHATVVPPNCPSESAYDGARGQVTPIRPGRQAVTRQATAPATKQESGPRRPGSTALGHHMLPERFRWLALPDRKSPATTGAFAAALDNLGGALRLTVGDAPARTGVQVRPAQFEVEPVSLGHLSSSERRLLGHAAPILKRLERHASVPWLFARECSEGLSVLQTRTIAAAEVNRRFPRPS